MDKEGTDIYLSSSYEYEGQLLVKKNLIGKDPKSDRYTLYYYENNLLTSEVYINDNKISSSTFYAYPNSREEIHVYKSFVLGGDTIWNSIDDKIVLIASYNNFDIFGNYNPDYSLTEYRYEYEYFE